MGCCGSKPPIDNPPNVEPKKIVLNKPAKSSDIVSEIENLYDEYQIIKLRRMGNRGPLTEAKGSKDEKVIIKSIPLKFYEDVDRSLANLRTVYTSNNDNFINMIAILKDTEYLHFVMEEMDTGDLFSFVSRKEKLAEKLVAFLGTKMLDALEFLHEREIEHGSLKPSSFVFDGTSRMKMIYYGANTNINDLEYYAPASANENTEIYLAPENFTGETTTKSDLWNFGLILNRLLTGSAVFPGETYGEVFDTIRGNEREMSKDISRYGADLIDSLLDQTPSKRPNIKVLRDHQFFSERTDEGKDCSQAINFCKKNRLLSNVKKNFIYEIVTRGTYRDINSFWESCHIIDMIKGDPTGFLSGKELVSAAKDVSLGDLDAALAGVLKSLKIPDSLGVSYSELLTEANQAKMLQKKMSYWNSFYTTLREENKRASTDAAIRVENLVPTIQAANHPSFTKAELDKMVQHGAIDIAEGSITFDYFSFVADMVEEYCG
eukprot:CAMPEP_0114995898 /NCGR_PEP_ID=MMETSP0216-20121206/13998_1 /TAXON_ID=223996 /ORGANISM="Protocruzia adherens, Strain Boccale" /LENGTH=489 /DNA_ID=CAMNT_0002360017 /DNA_START=31 /DNA_END=1500 /DNA_ORIENTATION=+